MLPSEPTKKKAPAPPPPEDTSMYAAPIEAQYQPGGENYLAPTAPQTGSDWAAAGGASGVQAAADASYTPTDPYNSTPSGTYPSSPPPPPPVASEVYGGPDTSYVPPMGPEQKYLVQHIQPSADTFHYTDIRNAPPPPGPASEYYGGEDSAWPEPGNPYADESTYRLMLARNPKLVQTVRPGTGTPPTYRYIPPAGSTYPDVERNRDLPPPPTIQDLQKMYPRAFPDIEPYWAGEGGRDAAPPPERRRYVPATTMNSMIYQYHSGEGAMGRSDPLDPRNSGELDGARPLIQYRKGPGEATGFTRYRRGWGGRTYLDNVAAAGGPSAPPPGYVPELMHHNGHTVSTRDMERARPRTLSPTPMPPPPNQPPLPPRGGYPYNDEYAPGEVNDLMTTLERGRRQRHLRRFKGLFGGGEDA